VIRDLATRCPCTDHGFVSDLHPLHLFQQLLRTDADGALVGNLHAVPKTLDALLDIALGFLLADRSPASERAAALALSSVALIISGCSPARQRPGAARPHGHMDIEPEVASCHSFVVDMDTCPALLFLAVMVRSVPDILQYIPCY